MSNTNSSQHAPAAPAPATPRIGAPRPGNFWQRWKEWERENGSVPAPIHEHAA
ncbi:MAG TPA: hypothetical protein VGB70_12205 [Allosphingosinicella sp.]